MANVLRRIKIDEVSAVDRGAGADCRVVITKARRHGGDEMDALEKISRMDDHTMLSTVRKAVAAGAMTAPLLTELLDRKVRKLATEHDLLPLYRTWFMQRLPTGERLGIDISPQLEESFRALDTSPGANN